MSATAVDASTVTGIPVALYDDVHIQGLEGLELSIVATVVDQYDFERQGRRSSGTLHRGRDQVRSSIVHDDQRAGFQGDVSDRLSGLSIQRTAD